MSYREYYFRQMIRSGRAFFAYTKGFILNRHI